jgi:hypothetical protein
MTYRVKNTTSVEYTGNTVFPATANRAYFFIVMTVGSGTIEFGGGGGKIPLATGYVLEPQVCPLSEISIESTGTYIVHMG